LNGGVGQRPNMYGPATTIGGGGRVRQMFEQRRGGNERGGKGSPIGWDKSYPLDPVEAVNSEVRAPIYKQNITRNNSYNKYSGNYGSKTTPTPGTAPGKRGMSLDRVSRGRLSQNGYGYGQTTGLVRAQSQANITGNSSSEDSYTSARPYSGFGFNNGNTRVRKPSGGSVSGRYPNYEVSPDESPPPQRRTAYQNGDRDYTRPLPPTYRRQGRSRVADPSPSRHSYHDSAYSSHSSHSSDNPAFSVISPTSTTLPRPPLSTQSSPAKSYSRQNSFSYDSNPRINSRTFRKQKSPMRNRSPSLSPSRSAENSDETDLATNDEYATRVASRTAEREREEERRRMQVEMRKREQELLARIKEQQKELDAVKAEKSKVEKQLSRQERERQEERRQLIEKEKDLEQERHRIETEDKERRQFEERERRLQEEQERADRHEIERRESKPHERVLRRDKASPAHLRGRRPPSLVSSDENEEDETSQISLLSSFTLPSPRLPKKEIHETKNTTPTLRRKVSLAAMPTTPTTNRRVPNDDLQRRPSLRRNASRNSEQPTQSAKLNRTPSIRKNHSNMDDNTNVSIKTQLTPSMRRKESHSTDTSTPIKIQRTPSIRRKLSQTKDSATKDVENKGLSLSRIRGPSREPSFDSEEKENHRNNRSKTTAYISNSNNTVKIEIKDAKKSVPPSPAIKKKGPAGGSTPARRSVFAPKPRDDLISCKNCQRNFAEDRIEKHEEICTKTSQKKRKTFDMTKARVKGTDAAGYVKNAAQLKAKEAKEQKKFDWRKKREEFINTLRAAKEAQKHLANGGSLKDLPPPVPSDTSDYIQCPHCTRRFAEGAAERHIPKCKDIKCNKKR